MEYGTEPSPLMNQTADLTNLPSSLTQKLELCVCVLFVFAAVLGVRTYQKEVGGSGDRTPPLASVLLAHAGMRMRRRLVLCLLVAICLRIWALVVAMVLQNDLPESLLMRWPEQMHCLFDFVMMLPTMVFLSALSVLVQFWAQVHYTTRMEPMPVLDNLFLFMNIGGYALVLAVAAATSFLRAWRLLPVFMICVTGLLSLVVAIALIYYGFMVWSGLSELAHKKSFGKNLTRRVLVLSTMCPSIMLIRGAFNLVGVVASGSNVRQPLWEMLVFCFASEWLPAVFVLRALQPQTSLPTSPLLEPDSTDSEAPLLTDAPMNVSTRMGGSDQGFTWKQIYPQPST